MTPLILAVDSGLDGAFVWMRGVVVLHHVLTRTLVVDGSINMTALAVHHRAAFSASCSREHGAPIRLTCRLEEPFNPGMTGRANSAGFAGSCMRFGRLQGWLESWGYEVRSVRPQKWQRELLDLSRFEIRTEKACAPRLAEGWKLKPYINGWRLVAPGKHETYIGDCTRAEAIATALEHRPGSAVTAKSVLSHDTKAASVAYAREHFPGVELVPPRCKNPHDGLADALCIAAWASKKETP